MRNIFEQLTIKIVCKSVTSQLGAEVGCGCKAVVYTVWWYIKYELLPDGWTIISLKFDMSNVFNIFWCLPQTCSCCLLEVCPRHTPAVYPLTCLIYRLSSIHCWKNYTLIHSISCLSLASMIWSLHWSLPSVIGISLVPVLVGSATYVTSFSLYWFWHESWDCFSQSLR